MRVCHVLADGRGGGMVYAEGLADALAAAGAEIAWVTPASTSGRRGGVGRLSRECRRADIVHAHGFRAALAAAPLSRRLLVTPHGAHLLRRATGARRAPALAAVRAVASRASAVICVSTAELSDLAPVLGRHAAKLVLVANGCPEVPLPTPEERAGARRSLGLDPAAPTLAFVGRLVPHKDPLLAVVSFAHVRALLPRAQLVVAGDGVLGDELRARAGAGVRLLGHVPDVHEVLVAADAVLNTSHWEGMSLALLEGMWRGRPAVAVNVPGNAEVVAHAGVLVDARDPRAVGASAAALLGDRRRLADLGARARARAEQRFGARRMIEETLAIYERCLAEPRHGRLSTPAVVS